MNDLTSILSDPCADQILRNLVISNRKWTEIIADILEIGRNSLATEAEAFVLNEAQNLLQLSSPTTSSSVQSSPSSPSDVRRGLDFLSAQSASSSASSAESKKTMLMNWFLEQLLVRGDVPFKEYSANRFVAGLLHDSYNSSHSKPDAEQLALLAEGALNDGGLTANLILLYTSVLLENDKYSFQQVDEKEKALIDSLARSKLLSQAQFLEMLKILSNVNNARIFLASPRMAVVHGNNNECSRFEVRGEVVAFATGLQLFRDDCAKPAFTYFEVTMRGKRTSTNGIRLGWASKLLAPSYRSIGSEEKSWILDLVTGKFFHASSEALLTVMESEVNSNADTETNDNIFGDLFGEDEEENTVDTAAHSLAESLSKSSIGALSNPEGAAVAPEELSLFSINDRPTNWSAVKTVGCLLDNNSGELHFFADGVYKGSAPDSIDFASVSLSELTFVIASNTSTVCDVNLGQAPFKYNIPAFDDVRARKVDVQPDTAEQFVLAPLKQISRSSHISFSLADRASDRFPLVTMKNISKESSKSLTFESSIRFSRRSGTAEDSSTSEFILFACSQAEVQNKKSCSDQGCLIGIDSEGRLFFETHESNRIKTEPNTIVADEWAHVSVSYTFHRSTGLADVLFYVNGQIALQTELAGNRIYRLNKLFARHAVVGLAPTASTTNAAFFLDSLDLCNIRVWTSSRSNDRVAVLMHRDKLVGNESELLVFLPCNEGVGHTLYDCSRGKTDGKVIQAQSDLEWKAMEDKSTVMMESWLNSAVEVPLSISAGDLQQQLEMIHNQTQNAENFIVSIQCSVLANLIKFRERIGSLSLVCAREIFEQPSFRNWIMPTNLNFQMLVSLIKFIHAKRANISNGNVLENQLMEILGLNLYFHQHCETEKVDRSFMIEDSMKMSIFRVLFLLIGAGCSVAIRVLVENIDFFLPDSASVFRLLMLLIELDLPPGIEHIAHTTLRRLAMKYIDSSPSIDEFFKMDPLSCVAVLQPSPRRLLIDSLCVHLSRWEHVSRLTSREHIFRTLRSRDTTVSNLAQGKSASTQCKLRHGSLVRRGPNWEYGDEDGGSVGVVLSVSQWKNQPNAGATVVWSNGYIDKYRFGVVSSTKLTEAPISSSEPATCEEAQKIYDLLIFEVDPSDQLDKATIVSSTKTMGVKYSPMEVDQALLVEKEPSSPSPEITKRAVLQYMQSNAPHDWVAAKGLSDSLNTLCQALSDLDVCQLYKQFHDSFGISGGSIQAQLHFALSPSMNSSDKSIGDVGISVLELAKLLLRCVTENGALKGAMSLLRSLQFGVFGCIENSLSNVPAVPGDSTVSLNYSLEAFHQQFQDVAGRQLQWNWTDGCWIVTKDVSKPDVGSAPSPTKEATIIHAKIIARFSFDNNHVPDNLQLRSRSRSCDITLLSDREWHTIVADMPLKPNTGNYVWYIKIRNMDKRSHFVFGVSTGEYSPEEYVGQDENGWGLSQNFELLHDGDKIPLAPEGHRISVGSILEVSLDTNKGKLRFLELTPEGEVLAMNREELDAAVEGTGLKDTVTFPAFSFFSPGDCVSLVTDPDEIKILRAKFTKVNSASAPRDNSKNSSALMCIYPGAPPTAVVDYALANIVHITHKFLAVVAAEGTKVSEVDVDLVLLTMHLVAMMNKWTTPPVHRVDELKTSLFTLMDVVRQWLEITSASDEIAIQNGTNLVELLMQFTTVIVSMLSKISSYFIRNDRFVPINEIILSSRDASKSFSQSKKNLTTFMSDPLLANGMRQKTCPVDSLQQKLNRDNGVRARLFETLDNALKTHSLAKKTRSSGESVTVALESVFLAFVYHMGMVCTMQKTLEELQSQQTPHHSSISQLAQCWDAAVQVLISAQELDQEESAESNPSSGSDILNGLLARAQFALRFQPLMEECESYDNYAHSNNVLAASAAESSAAAINHSHDSTKANKVTKSLNSFFLSNLDLTSVEKLCASFEDATRRRRDGFKLVKAVLDNLAHPIYQDIKAIFLNRLTMVLKGLYCNWIRTDFPQALAELKRREHCWYYTDGLLGIPKGLKKELMGAFGMMIAALISDLSSAQLNSGNYQLVLLAMLTERLETSDHELLSRVNFFVTLQELLESLLAMTNSSEDVTSFKADKILLMALKLFIFTGMQIATFGQDESNFVRSITLEFSAHELYKVKSGPATLNNAVFEILYDFLIALKGNSALVKDGAAIMSDCAGLLLCVSKHPECQKILTKSKWVALMMDLITFTSDATVQRLLLTLSDILLAVNPQSFAWEENSSAVAMCDVDASLSAPLRLVLKLLQFCGQSAVDLRWKKAKAVSNSCNFGIMSECVGLLRKLHDSSQWCTIVEEALDITLNEATVASSSSSFSTALSLLGSLLVLGGPLETLYVSCPVKVSLPNGIAIGVIKSFSASSDTVEVSCCKLLPPEMRDTVDALTMNFSPASTVSLSVDNLEPLHWQDCSFSDNMTSLFAKLLSVAKEIFSSSPSLPDTAGTLSKEVIARRLIQVLALKGVVSLLTHRFISKESLSQISSLACAHEFFLKVIEESRKCADVGPITECGVNEQYLVSLIALFNLDEDPSNPASSSESKGKNREESEESSALVETLVNMGFPRKLCVLALQICGGDPAEALNYILSNGSALVDMLNKQESREAARSTAGGGSSTSTSAQKKGEPCYYDASQRVFHPYFCSPSMEAERIGVLFPGKSFEVLEEMEIDGQVWCRVALSNLESENLQNGYGEDMKEIFVWVPKLREGDLVVHSGAGPGMDKSISLTQPALEPLSIQRLYRVIGLNGALARAEVDIGSAEIATLSNGTIVQAVEESVNSEGTLRLRAVSPINGWISKIPGLLERIPDQRDASLSASAVPSDLRPEMLLLMQLEDNFEVITGTDIFIKEDRFFGNHQGGGFSFLSKENARSRQQSFANRKQRITGAKNFVGMFANSSKDKITENFEHAVANVRVLLCRKILALVSERFLLALRSGSEEGLLDNALLRQVIEKTSPANLLRLVRYLTFRGDPFSSTGLEILASSALERLALPQNHVAIEEGLHTLLHVLLTQSSPLFRDEFFTLLVDMIAKNVRNACDKKFQDFSWLEATYAEDLDKDLLQQPNLHFSMWATVFTVEFSRDRLEEMTGILLQCLQIWMLSLRGTSMTLKLFGFRIVGVLIKHIRENVSSACEEALKLLQAIIPVDRLKNCAARRVWMEMEDSPSYSRFLQGFVAMLMEIDLLQQAIDHPAKSLSIAGERTTKNTNKVAVFGKSSSFVKFLPQKDIPGSWTLELWLQRRRVTENQYKPYLCPKSAVGAANKSSAGGLEKRSLSSLLQLLLGKSGSESEPSASTGGDESMCHAVDAEYLLTSSRSFVKLQKGGRLFDDVSVLDPLQEKDFVENEALCLSMGQHSSEERVFDCVVPYDRWVHLSLVVDHQQGLSLVYLDGKLADSQPFVMQCPIATLGSPRVGQSFGGAVQDLKIWSYARSQQEIHRNMRVRSLEHAPELLVHVTCGDIASEILYDRKSHIVACKGVDCTHEDAEDVFACGENESILAVISRKKQAAENAMFETSNSVCQELTGFVSIPGVGQKPPLSNGVREIIVVNFIVLDNDENKIENDDNDASLSDIQQGERRIGGFVHWSERNVKTALQGSLSADGSRIVFLSNGNDVLFGAPEKISWLGTLSYSGSFEHHSLSGPCCVSLKVETSHIAEPGSLRLDLSKLPREVSVSEAGAKSTITVRENSPIGKYLVFYHVYPHREQDEDESGLGQANNTWQGLVRDQGSVWVEFALNCSNGDVAFGWSTADALEHPDASVDVNEGAWTYSTAGQSSHGDDLFLSESSESGDRIGIHLNTDAGIVRFYKNDTVLVEFRDVLAHPAMLSVDAPCGLRPFVNLVSEPESVTLLGAKEGYTEIAFSEEDDLSRAKLCGFVERGAVQGLAMLQLAGETSSGWFGEWVNDRQVNMHVHVVDVNAESVTVSAAKMFSTATEVVEVDVNDSQYRDAMDAVVSRFATFRQRVCRQGQANHLFTNATAGAAAAPVVVQEVTEESLTISIQSGSLDAGVYSLPLSQPLKKIFSEFAAQHDCPHTSFVFSSGERVLDPEARAADYSLENNAMISAKTRAFIVPEGSLEDVVQEHFSLSAAKYVVSVIYEAGATVRDGVEIEECAALRTMVYCETAEAFEKTSTSEGIGRFRIPDGWISEKLRSATQTPVVRVLRELFDSPLLFKVKRSDGVKLRAQASLTSPDLGMIPSETVLCIGERRQIFSREESAWVNRLRVDSPEQYRGWVSEKAHLLTEIPQPAATGTSAANDPALAVELKRRAKVRILRQTRKTQERSARKRYRMVSDIKGEIQVSAESLFLLRKSRYSESVRFSPDFTTIKNGDSSGRSLVLGSRGFSHGVHYWEVEVKSANWGSVFIGVAPEEGSGWNGFGFINYRATQAFGSESLYGTYFGVNDKIGVLLDMGRGTISFFKDGEDFNWGKVTVVNMGVAYHNLRKSAGRHSSSQMLFPCFGLKSGGDELSIKHCHWISTDGFDGKKTLSRAIRSLSLVSEWRDALQQNRALQLSRELIDQLYEEYLNKRRPNELFTESRPGLPVVLRCAQRDLEAVLGEDFVTQHGISIGCDLHTVYGRATLLGVSSSRVWYSCEPNGKKAWYWLAAEFKALVLKGLLGERGENSSSLTSVASSAHTVTPAIAEPLSRDEFSRLLCESAWPAQKEHALVHAINQLSAHVDKDPTQLPISAVERFLVSKKICPSEESDSYIVRYVALCLLNKAVSIALPLVDLSVAEVKKTLTVTSIAKFDRNVQSLATPSAARDLLLGVKRSIFTATKMSFWQFAIQETTTPTTAPADEYERPDEIREISINRIKSRGALKKKHAMSFAEKLKVSVFGQVLENIASWDERSLRRSYVHMQDAGQSRGFFVKFVGEGVDDQGGPYRAVFQTAIEEEVPQLLELLVPCPNAKDEIGEHRDKFVFNRDVDLSSHANLFTHLGRLVGVATRHKILLPLSLAPLVWKSLAAETLTAPDLQAIDVSVFNSVQWIVQSDDIDAEHKHDLLLQILLESSKQCGVAHRLQSFVMNDLIQKAITRSTSGKYEESDLTIENIVDLVVYFRLMAQNEMMQLFLKGLSAAVPVELMSIFTAAELETVFCGESELDIDVLKKVTVYESVSPTDTHIQYFWKALEQLDKSELSQFINFCSGRSRLPTSASEYLMPFKLTAPHNSAEKHPDKYLPIARTCFFSLSVPKYTSVEACLSKLRYAITNTELMDADFIDRVGTSAWDNVQ